MLCLGCCLPEAFASTTCSPQLQLSQSSLTLLQSSPVSKLHNLPLASLFPVWVQLYTSGVYVYIIIYSLYESVIVKEQTACYKCICLINAIMTKIYRLKTRARTENVSEATSHLSPQGASVRVAVWHEVSTHGCRILRSSQLYVFLYALL